MFVIKRNGNMEPVCAAKISNRIGALCSGRLPGGHVYGEELNVDYGKIAADVVSKIQNNITTIELDEYAAEFCAAMTKDNYQYGILGGRLAVSNHQKQTLGSFTETVYHLYRNKNAIGANFPLIDEDFYRFVQRNGVVLDAMIDYSRDFMFDYFGFMTLQNGYFLKTHDGRVTERPQHMYMRMTVGFNVQTSGDDENILATIKQNYDRYSLGYISSCSPTMYNIGTHYQQLAACYLLGIADSIDADGGIPDCWKACAGISKRGGGIGIGVTPIRGKNSLIAGTSSQSAGIVPLARVFNNICTYITQGKRPGAMALYMEPWSTDIEQFLHLKKNHGVEEERARDLFYGLWIPDIFMERVEQAVRTRKPVMWSLMCPHECPGLYSSYGDEFKELYTRYESRGRFKRQVDIMTLWRAILSSQEETGTPYMLYKDHVNRKNNQANLGTIRCSNLCSEIVEYSDEKEYAVCNLASISLQKFVKQGEAGPYFDYQELKEVAYMAHRNLDRVITINRYPLEKCRRSNLRNRPVGLGVQGFADALLLMRLPFESTDPETGKVTLHPATRELNRKIFETIYYGAISASVDLAAERETSIMLLRKHYQNGNILFPDNDLDAVANLSQPSDLQELINRYKPIKAELEMNSHVGAYSTFAGSPASEGRLQYDLWGVTPSDLWDWDELKKKMSTHGLRNSLTTAIMPTASTAQILGNSECIEPYKYCVYTRRVNAGEYVVVNRFLHKELMADGLWTPDIQRQIIANRGSIQNIQAIPLEMRDRYKTAFEVSKHTVLELAADRGAFVDQSQSINIFISKPDHQTLTKVHLGGWKKGLKTGMYYLRREPPAQPVQFTVDGGMTIKSKTDKPTAEETEVEECKNCSA